jgi:hypothetical protein
MYKYARCVQKGAIKSPHTLTVRHSRKPVPLAIRVHGRGGHSAQAVAHRPRRPQRQAAVDAAASGRAHVRPHSRSVGSDEREAGRGRFVRKRSMAIVAEEMAIWKRKQTDFIEKQTDILRISMPLMLSSAWAFILSLKNSINRRSPHTPHLLEPADPPPQQQRVDLRGRRQRQLERGRQPAAT